MKKFGLLSAGLLFVVVVSGCGSIKTYTKVLHKENAPVLDGSKTAIFPAFARSGVRYAKRKVETILRYHLLMNKKKLGWKMTFPDSVKQAILDTKSDDLYLVIYHKYNALSHFAIQDLIAIGKKLDCTRIVIPEMVQESVKSGPYWIHSTGGNLNLTKLYDDYYIRLVLHIFDVKKEKFVYKIRSIGRVTKQMLAKDNKEESLGNAYSAAIEEILTTLITKKK